jgi:hypothetical protein
MTENLPSLFRRNERLTSLANHLVVALMLACALGVLVAMGEYLLPPWKGGYLVGFCFLIVIESMVTYRQARQLDSFSPELLMFRAAELVVILILFKLLLYFINGVSQLWIDIPLWRVNFLEYFFTYGYLAGVVVIFLAWSVTGYFADYLFELEGDERLLIQERESWLYQVRPAARRSLVNLILLIGGVIAFLMGFLALEQRRLGVPVPELQRGLAYLLGYFALSLVLLSLTQFAVLRVHWSLERIPVSPNLAARWLAYSLGFLLALGGLVILLPTQYSVGLLDILSSLFGMLLALLNLLAFLITLPFILIISLLARLFGKPSPVTPLTIKPAQPPALLNAGGASWLEWLKSLAFWLVFIGVIVYAVYYYLQQHSELRERLRHFPLFAALATLWEGLWGWLRGVNQNLVAAVQAGLRRLRPGEPASATDQSRRFVSLRRLSPRQRVVFFYMALVRRGGEHGLPRQPAQTPYEYSRALQDHLPGVESDISSMTDEFMEARYSQHEITAPRASLVQSYWERIKRALRAALKQ